MKKSKLAFISLLCFVLVIIGCSENTPQPELSQNQEVTVESSQSTTDTTTKSDSDTEESDNIMVMAFTLDSDHFMSKFFTKVYDEAFSRLGIEYRIETYPPERASELANAGIVDGEINRIYSYNETYTNLVRVEEPHMYLRFSAYSIDSNLKLDDWKSLENTDLLVGYRHGVQKCELMLPKYIAQDKLSIGYSIESNIQQLIDGKIDLYVDVENSIGAYFDSDTFKSDTEIFNAGVMEETTGHVFLHKTHRELAPKLAAVVKEMKAEGLFDLYMDELGLDLNNIPIR